MSAAGGTDANSGVASYQYRVAPLNTTTWAATQTGASVTLSTSGTWHVQFRTVDAAGNTSAWAPGTSTAADSACIW